MSTSLNSGHAKNAVNLSKLNQILATFGGSYNPANKHINLPSLVVLQTSADDKLTAVNTALTTWKNDTNNREIAFQDLDKFSTKLLGALQSMDVAPQTIDDFQALVKKMRGEGKLTKADAGKTNPDGSQPDPTKPAGDPTQPAPIPDPTISTSQQGFDNKLEHFGKMVLLLQNEALYIPNEAGFTVAELSTKLTTLIAANDTANTSSANLQAARIDRNTFFYKDGTGILSTVKQVKSYVKSLYGANSQQYKAVTAVPFFRVVPAKKAN